MNARIAIAATFAAIAVMACTGDPNGSDLSSAPTTAPPTTRAPVATTTPPTTTVATEPAPSTVPPSTVPSDTVVATPVHLVSIQVLNASFCNPCDPRIEFTGRAFVLGNRDVSRDELEVVAQGVLADDTWALWSQMLSELAEQNALGRDYGCPSCPADGAAAVMVVDVAGEQLTTVFDLLEDTAGLGALRGRTEDLFRRVGLCEVNRTVESIDCTGPFTATIGQP